MSNKNKKYFLKNQLAVPLFFVLFFVVIILFSAQAIKNIQQAQFEERVENTNVLMEKISHHVRTAANFSWENVHTAQNILTGSKYENLQQVLTALEHLDAEFGKTFWLVDESGQCYTSAGKSYDFPSRQLLISGSDEFLSEDMQMASMDSRAFYLTPLADPIQLENVQFTHLVLVNPMSTLDEYFDISNFADEGIAFIIRANGAQVYRHSNNNNNNNNNKVLPGVYNLLSALREGNYHRGASYESLRQAIKNGESDTISMTLNNESYFLAYHHLGIDDWTSILMIPDKRFGMSSGSLARRLTTNLIFIFLMMLMFVLCLITTFFLRKRKVQQEMNEHLKKAAEAEKAANLAKTNFLASMSHDIRTPMNAIVGILTLAKRRPEDNAYLRESMNKIGTAANQLLTLINDILDISKIESGQVVLNEEPFSVQEFVNRITSIITPGMVEKHHVFTSDVHDIAYDHLSGDRLRLSQIYLNLLSNAVKYTDPQGEIYTEVYEQAIAKDPDRVSLVMVVRDNGIGMSEAFQKRMYQTFSRETDSRTNKIQGTGLGLAICKQIADLMGGQILCDSQEGKGTTFTVSIPLTALPEKEVAEITSGELDTSALKGLHILVVEDNNVNWRIARDLLEDEGITTERAENGQECLELLEQVEENHFDAILMDVEMPVMNGKETTGHIRASQILWIRDIPIFATTANAFAEDVKSCLDAGMDDHISKPIDIEVLLKKLALIRGKDR